jgi:hypothetical protein
LDHRAQVGHGPVRQAQIVVGRGAAAVEGLKAESHDHDRIARQACRSVASGDAAGHPIARGSSGGSTSLGSQP